MEIELTTPEGGWTVDTLRTALSILPGEMQVRVFVPFDEEGPCTWESPRITAGDGVVKVGPPGGGGTRG